MIKVKNLGCFGDLFLDDTIGLFRHFQGEADIIKHGFMRIKRIALEDHRNVAILWDHVINNAAPNRNRAIADFFKTRKHAQQGRFATARRTYQNDKFAVFDIDIHAVHDLNIGVAFDDVFYFYIGHWASPYCGNSICNFTSAGGAEAAISNARTLSSNENVRVISGLTSITPELSIATQRGKTCA